MTYERQALWAAAVLLLVLLTCLLSFNAHLRP